MGPIVLRVERWEASKQYFVARRNVYRGDIVFFVIANITMAPTWYYDSGQNGSVLC